MFPPSTLHPPQKKLTCSIDGLRTAVAAVVAVDDAVVAAAEPVVNDDEHAGLYYY